MRNGLFTTIYDCLSEMFNNEVHRSTGQKNICIIIIIGVAVKVIFNGNKSTMTTFLDCMV